MSSKILIYTNVYFQLIGKLQYLLPSPLEIIHPLPLKNPAPTNLNKL